MGILVKNSGNPDSTCDRSGQIYTCGIFYYFVPDMDSFEKSVSFYFLSYGSAGDIYKYLLGNTTDGQEDTGNGKSISCESQNTDQVYLCIAGTALFSLSMQAFSWNVLEGRSGSRGYRSTFRFYW